MIYEKKETIGLTNRISYHYSLCFSSLSRLVIILHALWYIVSIASSELEEGEKRANSQSFKTAIVSSIHVLATPLACNSETKLSLNKSELVIANLSDRYPHKAFIISS